MDPSCEVPLHALLRALPRTGGAVKQLLAGGSPGGRLPHPEAGGWDSPPGGTQVAALIPGGGANGTQETEVSLSSGCSLSLSLLSL